MTESATSHYSFGDNDLAAARLERLAAAYAPSSAEFMRRHLPVRAERAIDLGCGLGFTTELLRVHSRASAVVGYERSPQYLARAIERFPKLTFRRVDVLVPPYPDREVDVVYSRFLLTHVHRPETVLGACVEHLRPGGRLLVEEASNLASSITTLQRYYAMVNELQAHFGQELYIGRRLAHLTASLSGVRIIAQETSILLPASTMAQLHAMNIATWKNEPHMLELHGLESMNRLESELAELAANQGELPPVTSEMMQIVVERSS